MAEQQEEYTQIPEKIYFKIGEVCQLTGIKAHTLRYWESEFCIIKPQRIGSQQRLYRRVDVENIFRIKKLLHDDGMTLAGTRKSLAKKSKDDKSSKSKPNEPNIMSEIKQQLIALLNILR